MSDWSRGASESPVPLELRTERLLLRPWSPADAPRLHPILESNHAHLGPWIPARVATPAPVPELERRLAGFRAEFDAGREWRYAMLTPDERDVFGEIGIFPRDTSRRVHIEDADRVEIGYWLRADQTGQGLATEAARGALAIARGLPGLVQVEIRCDARNVASAAVPQRLGFALARVEHEEPDVELQVWVYSFSTR